MQWLDPERDHTRRASRFMVVLGIVNLMGCNLAGLLWLWFAERVKQYRNGFRIAAIVLLTLQVLAGVFLLVWVMVVGSQGTVMTTPFSRWDDPPAWLIGGLIVLVVIVHGIPLWWLTAPGTAEAFRARQNDPNVKLCPGCQYNLRGLTETTRTCPECGTAIRRSWAGDVSR